MIDLHFFEQIIASLPDALLLIDKEGYVTYLNPVAQEMLGSSLSQIQGKKVEHLFPQSKDLQARIKTTLKTGHSFTLRENEWTNPLLRHTYVLEFNLEPLHTAEGQICGARLLCRDLSPLKKMEEDLKVADRLGVMGTIASGLAHEIKNPLGGIKGAAQMMLRAKPKEEWVEYLQMIVKETERVNELLVELLNFASPKKITLKQLNLNQLLEEVLCLEEQAAKANHIKVLRFYDPSLPDILGDENQLKQVFLNLIKNAREALGDVPGGKIEVRTRLFTEYQLKTEKGQAVRLIEIAIKDEGCGMEDEVLKRLFSPFFSTKKRGSGLGLAISHRIITEHQGFIQVESAPNRGTVFKVFLRAAS
ncbi:MAG: PAS domain S-box protein [Deltaproteobacteria bacterium]|nr:PAS domain S-box protein [Deltaproteobacteria bacterium]